jgi:alpha-beta hydrolase superfamily lysophospholipase
MSATWKALVATLAIGLSGPFYVGVRAYRLSRLLYFGRVPVSKMVLQPETVGIPDLVTVGFRSSDGLGVEGWYVRPHNNAIVVVMHGTSADRASMVMEIRILASAGFGILAFDWAGYGRSEGQAHWGADEQAALEAALDWLGTQGEVDPHRVGGLGFSMGGYILAQVASRDARLRAVVLEATPSDIVEQASAGFSRWGPITRLPALAALTQAGMPIHDPPPRQVIGRIAPRPVLVLGGSEDKAIPESMTWDLYEAAQMPKELWIIPGAAHGRYAQSVPLEYSRRLVDFFARTLL